MICIDAYGDLHRTPEEAIQYSKFYDGEAELLFSQKPDIQNVFKTARIIGDLGSGTGASALFEHRICPDARIITIDNAKRPFSEILRLLEGKHEEHQFISIAQFALTNKKQFDILFAVKSSHAIKSGDIEGLTKCLKPKGFLFQIHGDVELPPIVSQYFVPVWGERDYPTTILWQKI